MKNKMAQRRVRSHWCDCDELGGNYIHVPFYTDESKVLFEEHMENLGPRASVAKPLLPLQRCHADALVRLSTHTDGWQFVKFLHYTATKCSNLKIYFGFSSYLSIYVFRIGIDLRKLKSIPTLLWGETPPQGPLCGLPPPSVAFCTIQAYDEKEAEQYINTYISTHYMYTHTHTLLRTKS